MRKWLKDLRESKGLTQKVISASLGLNQPAYSMIENGDRQKKMSIEFADKLSKVLGVPIDTILKNEKGN